MSSTVSWAELEVYAGGTGEWLEYQLDRALGSVVFQSTIRLRRCDMSVLIELYL